MGIFGRRTPTTIVAAAQPVTGAQAMQGASRFGRQRAEAWQSRVWEYYDQIGEVRQVARSMGDVFARVPWYAGIRPNPRAQPLPLYTETTDEYVEQQAGLPAEWRYTTDEARKVVDALDALAAPIGGQAEIRRAIGVSLFIPGECYLVGEPEDDRPQEWHIRSTDELEIDWSQMRDRSDGEKVPTVYLVDERGKKRRLDAETVVIRIWRPHPRRQSAADSPMRSAEDICEELLILTVAIKGAALSRVAGAGVLFLPSSMRNSLAASSGDGQATRTDQVVSDIIEAASMAISDPSSAAAQVPLTIWMDDDLWEKLITGNPLVKWDREVDRIAAEQRHELLTRFANAIDWPAELLTGKVGINHWGAFLLKDEAFQSNAEPYEILAVDAVTSYYLRPAIEADGVRNPERFLVWYDPTSVVSDPDESDKGLKAGDHLLISWARERRALGFTEDDAPSEEELAFRIAIQAFLRNPALAAFPSPGAPSDGQGTPQAPPVQQVAAVELAAAPDAVLDRLTETLATLDRTLFVEVHQRADAAMRRTLERANARLASLARKAPTARRAVEGLDPADLGIGPTLGPAVIAQLTGAQDDPGQDLLAGGFATFGVWYDQRTARTQAEVLRMMAAEGLPSEQVPQVQTAFDEARGRSLDLLMAALIGLGGSLLLRPEPLGPPGESSGALVPPGVIRDALSAAGGGGEGATSLVTGRAVRDAWTRAGIEFTRYRWDYGDPASRTRPFEPHQHLGGVMFSSTDDDQLGNPGYGWPGVSHFWPGDHAGCLCTVVLSRPERIGYDLPSAPYRGGTL